ncbi:hypothetical protein HMPREF1548_06117 [Clostridium sp. KLE 1755]|nr:hypothetical protein HMPREF1548_06117 [Clostridium sp. KLE 1755]
MASCIILRSFLFSNLFRFFLVTLILITVIIYTGFCGSQPKIALFHKF